jgi:hypothetical protein
MLHVDIPSRSDIGQLVAVRAPACVSMYLRTTTDLAHAARAATFGAIEIIAMDIDQVVPGTIDDEGRIQLADTPSARTYGVVDQIAARAWLSGARVLAQ